MEWARKGQSDDLSLMVQVEIIGGEGEEDGEQPDTLRFVVEELHPELYTELLQGLRLAD